MEELFRQDVNKEVRNPKIRDLLTRTGIGEAANTGIRNIFAYQHQLRRLAPTIKNDFADRSFSITVSKGPTFTARQADLRTRFGVSLSDTEAALFLHVQAQDHIRILEAQSVAVATEQDTKAVLDRLVLQRLLDRHEDPNGPFFTVAEHLKAAPAALAAITAPLGFVPTEKQWQILAFCDSPKSILQLMNHLGVTSRPHFRHDHPDALVAQQLIRLSDPTKPTSPRQTYVLTDAGFAILADKERGLFAPQAAPMDPAKLSPSGTTASRSRLT